MSFSTLSIFLKHNVLHYIYRKWLYIYDKLLSLPFISYTKLPMMYMYYSPSKRYHYVKKYRLIDSTTILQIIYSINL